MRLITLLLLASLHGCSAVGPSRSPALDIDRVISECDAMSDLFRRYPKIDLDKFMEAALSNDPDWRFLTMEFLSQEGKRIGLAGDDLSAFTIRMVGAFYQEAVLVMKELKQEMPRVETDAIRNFLLKHNFSAEVENIFSSLFKWYGKGPDSSQCRLHR